MGSGSTVLLNTVAANKARYIVSDYKRAEKARTIQQRMGRPSTPRYMELATKGRITNCDSVVRIWSMQKIYLAQNGVH
jgi:hypothetical protein